jgi:hypothetical protein
MFSVSPSTGHYGTVVTITGQNLLGGAPALFSATLGGISASVVSATGTKVVLVASASSTAITGDVRIESVYHSYLINHNIWNYVDPANITSVTPASGQVGTVVTIAGSTLLMGAARIVNVTLAGQAAGAIVSSTNAAVVVTVASAGATSGVVVLTADSGAVVQGGVFTYLAESTLTTVTPSSGQFGTVVTLSGLRLYGGGAQVVSVTLAGTAASIVNESDSEVVVVAGDRAAGSGHVVVTADTGATTTLMSPSSLSWKRRSTSAPPRSAMETGISSQVLYTRKE